MDEMLLKSTPLGQMNGNWVHISKSAQQLKTRPGTIIEAIRTGKINLVGNYRNRKGYQSLYVNHHEVTALLGNAPPPAQSIEVFSKSVGMNQPSKMRRLIRNGFQQATLLKNPRTKADQFSLTVQDISKFHAEFQTSRTIALHYDRSWQSVCAELKSKKVRPFSPDGADYGNIYLRSDVTSALS